MHKDWQYILCSLEPCLASKYASACIAVLLLFLSWIQPTEGIGASETEPALPVAFAWKQDEYWQTLEERYRNLRGNGCQDMAVEVSSRQHKLEAILAEIRSRTFAPDAPVFTELEKEMFGIAPLVGGCMLGSEEYLQFVSDMRDVVKRSSETWDMNSATARTTLYRLLYGARTAVEELIVQFPSDAFDPLVMGEDEPSSTPSVLVGEVRVHSGDILVSRGGAPTSALIARGNDFPGNFSHIALVYVDPLTVEAQIVEARIEAGVVISTVDQYLQDKKLRLMLLRPRADLPQLIKDPMLPHRAAEYMFNRVKAGHISYDFAMDYQDHEKLFCSEVASSAYEHYGVTLWTGISRMSSPGLRRWLGDMGVTHFETQEPSDLEYDPQLRVVAEWRDLETLMKDRVDNAVTEVMLEGAEQGDSLDFSAYQLPLSYLAKVYSATLNLVGGNGPIPEGMTPEASLRILKYIALHDDLADKLHVKKEAFRQRNGYEAPYWGLVRLAREAKHQGM